MVARLTKMFKVQGSALLGVVTAGVLMSFAAQQSFAVALGDITLESSLNEPLEATIELRELDGLTRDQINAGLGSPADFERIGLERQAVLDTVAVDVEVTSNSNGLLRLSSSRAINAPYLTLLINVQTPVGRLLREYTVLLDLPVFSTNAPAPAQPSLPATNNVSNSVPAPADQPQVSRPAPVTDTASNTAPGQRQFAEPDDSDLIVIQPGDTLWEIALQHRPDDSVSVQQMMVAIQRANTSGDAFISNNINRIRSGQVLRIPPRAEIVDVSLADAINQVAVQNQAVTGAQPLAVNNTGNNASAGPTRDELSIVTGTEGVTGGGNDLSATIANLENQLALSEENLDRASIENAELNSRLRDLEEQVELLENILAIENQRIADLQAQLSVQAEAAEQARAEAQALAAAAAAAPAPVTPAANTGAGSFLQSSMAMFGSLGVLLALIIGLLLWRNRRAAQNNEEEVGDLEDVYTVTSVRDQDDHFTLGDEDLDVVDNEVGDVVGDQDEQEDFDNEEEDFNADGDFDEDDDFGDDDDDDNEHDGDDFNEEDDDDLDDDEDYEDDVEDDQDVAALVSETEVSETPEEKETLQAGEPVELSPLDFTLNEAALETETATDVNSDEEQAEEEEPVDMIDFGLVEAAAELDEKSDEQADEKDLIDISDNAGDDNDLETFDWGNLTFDESTAEDLDEDSDVITDQDESATKLDLAVAYHAMNDLDGARGILEEVIEEGNEGQVNEAKQLLAEWGKS